VEEHPQPLLEKADIPGLAQKPKLVTQKRKSRRIPNGTDPVEGPETVERTSSWKYGLRSRKKLKAPQMWGHHSLVHLPSTVHQLQVLKHIWGIYSPPTIQSQADEQENLPMASLATSSRTQETAVCLRRIPKGLLKHTSNNSQNHPLLSSPPPAPYGMIRIHWWPLKGWPRGVAWFGYGPEEGRVDGVAEAEEGEADAVGSGAGLGLALEHLDRVSGDRACAAGVDAGRGGVVHP